MEANLLKTHTVKIMVICLFMVVILFPFLCSLADKNQSGDSKSASWLVELTGGSGTIKIISISEKGGLDEREITIK